MLNNLVCAAYLRRFLETKHSCDLYMYVCLYGSRRCVSVFRSISLFLFPNVPVGELVIPIAIAIVIPILLLLATATTVSSYYYC